jgi:cellulose synthase (UDP-forming)
MIARCFPYLHLRRRYDCYPPTALLLALLTALAWLFLRLESPVCCWWWCVSPNLSVMHRN